MVEFRPVLYLSPTFHSNQNPQPMSHPAPTISAETAKNLTAKWNEVRNNENLVNNLLQPGFFFAITNDFDPSQFEGQEYARAYIGLSDMESQNPNDLCLLWISESQDEEYARNNGFSPYVYQSPYMGPEMITPLNKNTTFEMVQRWDNNYQEWVGQMVSLEHGMTRVFDVPLEGVIQSWGQQQALYVYVGLKSEEQEPETALKVDLLLYDNNSGNFLINSPDDFTTPKPPFMFIPSSLYGLL